MLVLIPANAAAQSVPEARQVLVLQSLDRGSLVFDRFTAEFRAALQKRLGTRVTLFDFVVVPAGIRETPGKPAIDFLQSTYANRRPPDVIVTVGGPAAAFARSNRQLLFPRTPIIFASVEARYLGEAPLAENETSVTASIDYPGLIDDILQLLPETQNVFMVTGSGPLSTFWETELGRNFERYRDRVTFIWSSDLSYEQLLQRVATLPRHSAIFYITSGTFATETGVGKERFAQAIHDASPRRHRPMIRVSCAALPATLIESELFGHERGAFTDAVSRRIGRFEAASGSTLFLDEIGELSPQVQVKLLRVLEERQIERLGSSEPITVDIRIIAATHRDLESAVSENRFREDLFYRLNAFPITIPPLRERREDILDLAWAFIDEFSDRFGRRIESIAPQSLRGLQDYPWPGNVRELRNVIERAMIVAGTSTLTPVVPSRGSSRPRESTQLVDVQKAHITSVLEGCGWRVRGQRGAAQQLGVKPTTLESKMERLGIRRNRGDSRDA